MRAYGHRFADYDFLETIKKVYSKVQEINISQISENNKELFKKSRQDKIRIKNIYVNKVD